MKFKYFILIIIILFSCEFYNENIENKIEKIILNNLHIMKYISDDPYIEYWETKEEIYNSLDGDCEEFVNKNIFDIYDQLNIKCNLIIMFDNHAVLEYNNQLYECSNYINKTLKHRYNYYDNIYQIIYFDNLNYEIKLRRIK